MQENSPMVHVFLLMIRMFFIAYPGLGCSVTPYAVSSPDWINEIINTHRRHGYETLDYDNVPTTIPRPLYINVAADGSLDLPPQLRNIVNEFEQLYENTRYKRLQPRDRRRSVGGAVDGDGNPVYDGLQRETTSTDACQENKNSQGVQGNANVKVEHKQHYSVDLGELRGFIGALQRNECCMEMTEMATAERRYRRRFSVDMGQVRGFIALRKMNTTKVESSALADQPEAEEASQEDATR